MYKTVMMFVSFVLVTIWLVMFFAGHDVWNDTGRPDLWQLKIPPYNDLRLLVICFYCQAFFILINLIVQIKNFLGFGKAAGKKV